MVAVLIVVWQGICLQQMLIFTLRINMILQNLRLILTQLLTLSLTLSS